MQIKHVLKSRHALLRAALLAVAVSFLVALPYARAQQQCITGMGAALKNRAPGSDGFIHITYGFNDLSVSTNEKLAIETAVGEWNGVKSTTGVVFDPAPPGAHVDLEFKPDTDSRSPSSTARRTAETPTAG
jgi:hypothetical protein